MEQEELPMINIVLPTVQVTPGSFPPGNHTTKTQKDGSAFDATTSEVCLALSVPKLSLSIVRTVIFFLT